MGNTSSTQSKGEKERTLLKPIDNYESFVFEANETTFRRRRKVPRQGSRKRSHTQLTRCSTGDSRQPAGCLSTAGPIGDRWPIEGVPISRFWLDHITRCLGRSLPFSRRIKNRT